MSDYDALAAEYYDHSRHPTSANFGEASLLAAQQLLQKSSLPRGAICDVGSGRSIVPQLFPLVQTQSSDWNLILVDGSRRMLHTNGDFGIEGA